MQKDKGILAVVPAWGGSKAVNLKDLRPVLRVPVVARVGRVGEVVAQVPMLRYRDYVAADLTITLGRERHRSHNLDEFLKAR